MVVSHKDIKYALSKFATGVTILTAGAAKSLYATTVNAFSSVSLNPPLCSVCLSYESDTYAYLAQMRPVHYVINILTTEQQLLAQLCASPIKPWHLMNLLKVDYGTYRIGGSLVSLVCVKSEEVRAGDHAVIIGEVIDLFVSNSSLPPLTYYSKEFGTVIDFDHFSQLT